MCIKDTQKVKKIAAHFSKHLMIFSTSLTGFMKAQKSSKFALKDEIGLGKTLSL